MGEVARPSGTVTFLFTDVEGSTALWASDPDAMSESLALHDAVLRRVFEDHRGFVFATGGDGLAVAFGRVHDGVEAAAAAQEALAAASWPEGAQLKVRMGLHVGEVEERDGDYFGPAVNRAARIMDAGHGGQVLASTPLAEIAGDYDFTHLGRHRLRGFGTPDEIWQLGANGFPPLRSQRQAGNLPRPVTSFVGRESELAETGALLDHARLLTLVGVGGVGKTRLAVETGRRSADSYADGVWFVDLASRGDPDAVVEAISVGLGVAPQPGTPISSALVDHLAQRWLLLILDNCEHLLDAVADACTTVLEKAEGVTVLATSREPLGIPGEQVWAMPSLAQAPDLFVERANEAGAGFDPSADERQTIETICTRVDRIPLAVELAAARTRSMTVSEISDALDDRFRLLRGSGRGGTERHQTLQATVQWSVDLLDDLERRLFESLCVFPADFDLAAVEAVCAPTLEADVWDVRDHLDRLVDRSLLAAGRAGPTTRFRLLETFRQFGEQRLNAQYATALRRAHLDYFADIAEQTGAGFWDRDQEPDPDPWAVERDNILAAMQWAITDDNPDACAHLARASYQRAGWWADAEMTEWAIAAAEQPNARAAVVALAGTSLGYANRGDLQAALDYARRAVELDPSDYLAWSCVSTSMYTMGISGSETAQAATNTLELMPTNQVAARALQHGIRALALLEDDPQEAEAEARRVQEMVDEGLSRRGVAMVMSLLAIRAMLSGDLETALDCCTRGSKAIETDAGLIAPVGIHRITAEVLAMSGDDPAPSYLAAIELAGAAGWWAGLARLYVSVAGWWLTNDRREAAALAVECMATNNSVSPELDELRGTVDQSDLTEARDRGRSMSRTELLDYVLSELDPVAVGGSLDTHLDQVELTDRQLDVAQLVARGLSNKDIAARLDISPYTVETHVRNILERLDATNRAQIVAWVMANEHD